MAKSFLEGTWRQPCIVVSAINPDLYNRVGLLSRFRARYSSVLARKIRAVGATGGVHKGGQRRIRRAR